MAKITPAQIVQLQKWVAGQMGKADLGLDSIDFQAELDREINYSENKTHFQEMLSTMIFDLDDKIKQARADEEKRKDEEQREIQQKEKELIDSWKTQKLCDIEVPEFETAKHLIKSTIKGFNYATIIEGEAGIGKTFLVLETLKNDMKDNEWEYFNGYSTSLCLYKTLYENNGKVVVLDDIEGVFDDNIAVSILKNTLWDSGGKRIVFWQSTSSKLDSLPSHFEFTGKLIILCNEIPRANNNNLRALLSRTNHYKLQFTYNQKLKIIETILENKKGLSKEQKAKVMGIIKSNTNVATLNFNIRTMEKLCGYVKYNSKLAETLFQETTEKDEYEEIIFKLIDKGLSVSEQVAEFERQTGKHRSTYFSIKKEVMAKMSKSISPTSPTGCKDGLQN